MTSLQADGSYSEWRTLAGSGYVGSNDGNSTTASFKQPHGLTVAASAGFVYVADTFNSCIRRVSIATGNTATVAGTCGLGGYKNSATSGHDALFNHPHKVTVDPRNESLIYVAEIECSDGDSPLYAHHLHRFDELRALGTSLLPLALTHHS